MSSSRREFLKKGAGLAAVSTLGFHVAGCNTDARHESAQGAAWPIGEGPDTPKICVGISREADPDAIRGIKQIGADHVLMGGPPMPWKEEDLRATMGRFEAGGLKVINMMISGFPNTIYGREGRDQEIEQLKQSILAAGAVGLPVVEYNFYAHRLMAGYHEVKGRGNSGYTGFDYAPVKDLPPDPAEGPHKADALWDNLAYFLKEIIPVAEKAGVRMALHPNDPPVPVSHGSDQIMKNFDDWKRLIGLADSPSNGMTFDCGVTRETGADPVEVCRWLGERDRINHVHFRNVLVDIPSLKYVEVFPDNGLVNMFEVMQELVRLKYPLGIYPEHPRALDYDKTESGTNFYPGGGRYTGLTYNVAYARAMMQAVLAMNSKQ